MYAFVYVYLVPLLIVVTALQRFLELSRSRTNQGEMRREGFARVDSPKSYICMVLVHSTWFVAIIFERYTRDWLPSPIIFVSALTIFFLAQFLRAWAITSLGMQWNVQVMAPSSHTEDPGVVATGPYRYVRHPNYLAVILEFLSLPLLAGAPLTAAIWTVLNGAVLWFRIRAEESSLFKRPGYRELFGDTPRLIPSVLRKPRQAGKV